MGSVMNRSKEWHAYLGEFVLYNLLGLIISSSSTIILALGLYEQAEAVLGRRLDNPLGIIGSYFIHRDFWHLLGNFAFYLMSTFIVFIFSKANLGKEFLLGRINTWRRWNLLVLALMLVVGVVDLQLDRIYQFGKIGVGMSDLTSALLPSALAYTHLAVYWSVSKRDAVERRVFYALLALESLIIAALSLMLILLFDLHALAGNVNAPAHGFGISTGITVSSILLLPGGRSSYRSYIPLTTYMIDVLLVVLGWKIINPQID